MGAEAVKECRRTAREHGITMFGPEDRDGTNRAQHVAQERAPTSVSRMVELREQHDGKALRLAATALATVAEDRSARHQLGMPERNLAVHVEDYCTGESLNVALLAVLAWESGDWPPSDSRLADTVATLQRNVTHKHLSTRLRHAAKQLRSSAPAADEPQ